MTEHKAAMPTTKPMQSPAKAGAPKQDVLTERDPHKTIPDLEDRTGNPGHRGVNPNEAHSINPVVGPEASSGPPSINEPPGSQVISEQNERDTETATGIQKKSDAASHAKG